MCPIDDKGKARAGFRFIRAFFGTMVNEIGVEDYRDIEVEGVEYETPNVNGIQSYNYGNDLIHQSIGSFE